MYTTTGLQEENRSRRIGGDSYWLRVHSRLYFIAINSSICIWVGVGGNSFTFHLYITNNEYIKDFIANNCSIKSGNIYGLNFLNPKSPKGNSWRLIKVYLSSYLTINTPGRWRYKQLLCPGAMNGCVWLIWFPQQDKTFFFFT